MIPPDPDALELRLEDCAWLHSLAASLMRDAQGAEDVAQEALVAALEGRRGGRAWLAGVVRNLTRQGARRETRRRDREARAHRENAEPSAGEVVERLDLQQHVVAAVKGLEEPYRTAVVLRHFDGLPPREIARRLGIPVKTVHSRLDRAHEKLRARLDRALGRDGKSWMMALIPLLESSGGKSAALGGVVVSAQVKIAAVVVALVAGAWVLERSLGELPEGPSAEQERVDAQAAVPPAIHAEERTSSSSVQRTPVEDPTIERVPPRPGNEVSAAIGVTATLDVRVVDKQTLAPVPQAQVYPSLVSGDPHGARMQNGLTDGGGLVQLEVPASCILLLRADPPAPGSDPAISLTPGLVRIEPLAPAERRLVTLELEPPTPLDFHGRVVTAEQGSPIVRAEIRLAQPWTARTNRAVLARTDEEGRFGLHLTAPSTTQLDIRHSEYGPAWVELVGLVTSESQPHEIPLERAAALEGLILAPTGYPADALTLELVCRDDAFLQPRGTHLPSWREERWTLELDATRSLLFPNLPANVELIPQLKHGEKLLWVAPEPLVLEPGERRVVTWNLRQGARVAGRLVDQDAKPVPLRELWLLRAGERYPAAGAVGVHLSYMDEKHVAREVMTDPQGRFELSGLEAGSWWIGPAPRGRPGKPTELDEVAAFARLLEIPEGDDVVELELEAQRGLFVRGKIVGMRFEPSDMVMVTGFPRGGLGAIQVHAERTGEFRLGPLADVDYNVRAFTYPTVANTAQAWASPGTAGLVLGVSSTAFIEGRIVDALTGEGTNAKVHLVRHDGGSRSVVIGPRGPGRFRFETVEPGLYTVSAHMDDGRFAMESDLLVDEDHPAEELVLRLEPGGFLDLGISGGSQLLRCALSVRGVTFRDFHREDGKRTLQCVPEGVIEVRVYQGLGQKRETLETRSVQVTAGAREHIDIRLDP